jgi:predicted ATPase
MALLDQMKHPYTESRALYWNAMLYEMRREWPIVEERAVGAMKSAGEHGFALVLAAGQILQGAATAAGGQPAEGSKQIRDGIEAYRATGALIQGAHHLVMLAEALGAAGLPGEGLEALKDAADLTEATGERYYEAEIHRQKGELLLAVSPQASTEQASTEAEACFRQALEVARSQEAKSLELRAANSLACLWRTQGKSAKAHELLAEVYDWFTEGHDTVDLKKAKRTLDGLKAVTTA